MGDRAALSAQAVCQTCRSRGSPAAHRLLNQEVLGGHELADPPCKLPVALWDRYLAWRDALVS